MKNTRTQTHMCTHTHTHTRTQTHMCTHTHTYTNTRAHAHTHTYTNTHVNTHTHTHLEAYTYMNIYKMHFVIICLLFFVFYTYTYLRCLCNVCMTNRIKYILLDHSQSRLISLQPDWSKRSYNLSFINSILQLHFI
jgi:hypothetical protein